MKICFIHPSVKDIPSFLKLTRLAGRVGENSLVWDEKQPDILFASEWIYYRKEFFEKFRSLYPNSGLKVAYFGEAIDVDWNVFDYGIGFSDAYSSSTRFFRILSPADMFVGFIPYADNEISDPEAAKSLLEKKTGFCNFLYSNPKAHPMRDTLFYEISRYKRVDSLGRHLNNVATPGTGYGNGHAIECIGLKSPYKFSIASENASFCGYTSEKCFTSLLAHSVPIYWGNPDIKDDFNPDAFINVGDYGNLDDVIAGIKEIDENDDLWAKMVSAPWRTPEQVAAQTLRTEKYYAGMVSLFSGSLSRAVPRGFHPDLYKDRFLNGKFPMEKTIIDKLRAKIRGK